MSPTMTGTGFWQGRRVAVTGATGFVGHQVAMQLLHQGAAVTALVRPTSNRSHLAAAGVCYREGHLEDRTSIVRACSGCDILFHVAAGVHVGEDWDLAVRSNVLGTRNVVAAARAAGVRRLVHTSSIAAVGIADGPSVLDETASWNLGRLRVPYCTTKRRAEEQVLAHGGKGLDVVVVNPASVVGPDDYHESGFGTVCRRFWRGHMPLHFGGGNSYVDVRDVAAGHLLAAEHGRAGERYILGGTNLTYTAFFAELARLVEWPIFRLRLPNAVAPMVAALDSWFGSKRHKWPYLTRSQARLLSGFFYFSSAKAIRELGYQPRPARASLADAYTFWLNNRRRRAA
jgi:dihydroflavonol-4-reductase